QKSVRMTVESVSGCSWNECPDQRGITVRMRVEWVSESAWNPHFRQAPGASVMAQQVKIGRSTPEGVEVFELQPGLVRVPSSSDR
ncbi:hypothetical protein N1E65_19255, partial [Pseudomonas aeruginosa]|nr:hypothetical protein [Pseudomonas aeruginosa]